MVLRFVTATRDSLEVFKKNSPLFRSLERVSQTCFVDLDVIHHNRAPLAMAYNAAIARAAKDDLLVFIHDDVSIDDWLLFYRLEEALIHFDVVGLAGNKRREPRQEGWFIQTDSQKPDLDFISGAIAHGESPGGRVSFFGKAPQTVLLLDGVFLAARAGVLQNAGAQFDPQFPFHFYDTDFCRSCEAKGLRLGTWPIAVTHRSSGQWQSPEWDKAFALYLQKWGD
jgi:GT2 family glycosyltransferase